MFVFLGEQYSLKPSRAGGKKQPFQRRVREEEEKKEEEEEEGMLSMLCNASGPE